MTQTELTEILNQQPFGVAELTAEEGNYIFFNEQERLFRGLSYTEMQSVSIFDLLSKEYSKKLRTIFEQCARSSTAKKYFLKYKSNERTFQMRWLKVRMEILLVHLLI